MSRPARARESVLDAFERILIEDGGRAATMDATARVAGVSKGGLLYHFGSKEALESGLIERLKVLAARDIEVEVLDDGGRAERLADTLDAEEGFGHRALSDQFGLLADFGAKRDSTWITDMQPQVMAKAITASAAGS